MLKRLRKDRAFMAEEEKELFRTPPLIIRKWRVSAQLEQESSIKRPTGRVNDNNDSLINTPTSSPSNMIMNPF